MAKVKIKKAKRAAKPKAAKPKAAKARRGKLPKVGDLCKQTNKKYVDTTVPRDNDPRPLPKAVSKKRLPSFEGVGIGMRILHVLAKYGTIDRDNVHNLIGSTNTGLPFRMLHAVGAIVEVKDSKKCGIVTLKRKSITWEDVKAEFAKKNGRVIKKKKAAAKPTKRSTAKKRSTRKKRTPASA